MPKFQPITQYKQLLYLFLLPVFFLLHGYNENFGLIPLTVMLQLFLVYFLVVTAVAFVVTLLMRTPEKAFVFSFFLLSLYFFFGAFHDALKAVAVNLFIASYKFLLPFLLLVCLVIFIVLKRRKYSPVRSAIYLRWLLQVLLFLEIVTLLYFTVSGKEGQNNLASQATIWKAGTGCERTNKPDIFFIVFDGLTSSPCLKEEFNYDNRSTDSLFQAYHFFVSRTSRSNYNATPFSQGCVGRRGCHGLLAHHSSKSKFRRQRFTGALHTSEERVSSPARRRTLASSPRASARRPASPHPPSGPPAAPPLARAG